MMVDVMHGFAFIFCEVQARALLFCLGGGQCSREPLQEHAAGKSLGWHPPSSYPSFELHSSVVSLNPTKVYLRVRDMGNAWAGACHCCTDPAPMAPHPHV